MDAESFVIIGLAALGALAVWYFVPRQWRLGAWGGVVAAATAAYGLLKRSSDDASPEEHPPPAPLPPPVPENGYDDDIDQIPETENDSVDDWVLDTHERATRRGSTSGSGSPSD